MMISLLIATVAIFTSCTDIYEDVAADQTTTTTTIVDIPKELADAKIENIRYLGEVANQERFFTTVTFINEVNRLEQERLEAERIERERRAATTTTTTTTTVVSTPTTTSSSGSSGAASGSGWAALRNCESGGNYSAVSASGKFRGAYQFMQSTWDSVARSNYPHLVGVDPAAASPGDQDRMAAALYASSGASPWPHCGRYL